MVFMEILTPDMEKELFDILYNKMAYYHPICVSRIILLKNDSSSNIKNNIHTLQTELTTRFSYYSQLSSDLRRLPLTAAEIECIKMFSERRACWLSSVSYMAYRNRQLTTYIVGDDQEYELCDSVWVKTVPDDLIFSSHGIPDDVTSKEDYFYKLVLFARVV